MIVKTAEIKQKVTADLVLDIYEEAKKKRGKARKELMKKAEVLSKHLGCYLAKINTIIDEDKNHER